jgi:hypothetical protein
MRIAANNKLIGEDSIMKKVLVCTVGQQLKIL